MTEANPLKPTWHEILSELTGELRKTQRVLRTLQTEKSQIHVKRIRDEKALEKLEKQIKEQEGRVENTQDEPEKQENARQALEQLQTEKQHLLDEQAKNAGKPDELDGRIQEMEQKKTTVQKEITELKNYLTRQLFSVALSRLTFFFMAVGIFLILVGLAGVNWHGSINPGVSLNKEAITGNLESWIANDISSVCETFSVCSGWGCGILNDWAQEKCRDMKDSTLNPDKWRQYMQEKIGEMEEAMNQEAERKIKQLLQSVSEFLIVIGLVMFIIFGTCWVGLERRRMLNWPATAED